MNRVIFLGYLFANELVDSDAFNTTMWGSGSVAYYPPNNFVTEIKGPYVRVMFVYSDQGLPAGWWVTFDVAIYMRNE